MINNNPFDLTYNTNKGNTLKLKNKVKRIIVENKILNILIILFLLFCMFNSMLIFTFLSILKNF